MCAYPSISRQDLPVHGQMCVFQLAEGQRVEQEAEGKVCICRDKERGCISDTRSVGHSRLTARTGCQVRACCRLMVATLKRARGLLAAASSAPSSPCVDARSQWSKGNPATPFIFYNCCFWLSPITFSFLLFSYCSIKKHFFECTVPALPQPLLTERSSLLNRREKVQDGYSSTNLGSLQCYV